MSHDTPPEPPEPPDMREPTETREPTDAREPTDTGEPTEALIDQLVAREIAWAEQALPLAPTLPAVDLRTLASALTGLRSELRVETRAVRDVRDRVGEALASLDAGLARWSTQQEVLVRRLEERGLGAAEQALFDVADRLDVTVRHTMLLPLPPPPRSRLPWRWGGRARARLAAIEEGLRLTQARLEDHLTGLGIQRLPSIGRVYDPETMEAVDRVIRPDLPEGTVVDELAAGYRRGDRILRPARVIVSSGA